MEVPKHLQLTLADYTSLLDMLDRVPMTGMQNHRGAVQLEQKLIANAKAAAEKNTNNGAGKPVESPAVNPEDKNVND